MNWIYKFLSLCAISIEAKDWIVCVHDLNVHIKSFETLHVKTTFAIGDFQGYVIENLTEESLTSLHNEKNVVNIEVDDEVSINYGWGLDRVNQKHLPLDGNDKFVCGGTNVDVYILDTGIRISHRDFGGRAIWGANTVGDGKDYDCQGPTYHGTHVASTTIGNSYGIARRATAIAVKVLGCTGSGSYSGIIKGVEWSVNRMKSTRKASVMNLSLGGGKSTSINSAMEAAVKAGMHTVVAAGNSNADACNYSPASAPSVITVASVDKTDVRSSFSNWGCCVDIFAPGRTIPAANGKDDSSFHYLSGTSMASPHAAGVAELATDDKVQDPKDSDNELLHMKCEGGGGKCEKKLRRRSLENK